MVLYINITKDFGAAGNGLREKELEHEWNTYTLPAINKELEQLYETNQSSVQQSVVFSKNSGNSTKSVMQSTWDTKMNLSNMLNGVDNNPTPSCAKRDGITSEQKTSSAKKETKEFTRTRRDYNGNVSAGNVDKRVALTVAPRTENSDETTFVDKVIHTLGQKSMTPNWVLAGSKFYGLLRNALGTTSGLIFPYTPKVSFNHSVDYDTTSITHTNLSYNYYKNTPTPSISVAGKFTADNRQNALHMLSAIWFLTACSKCDFGENTANPGLPPPIIYLSGYNSLIDNIPVVIKSFNYSYPDDKHYVNLVLDMSKDNTEPDSQFCKVYDYSTTIDSYSNYPSYIAGSQPVSSRVVNKNGGINLSFWLPTELDISIDLLVQPNMIKNKKQWSLSRYQSGYLMTNKGKNPSISLDTMDTKTIMREDYDANCNKVQIPTSVDVKENLNFIPSGWTW